MRLEARGEARKTCATQSVTYTEVLVVEEDLGRGVLAALGAHELLELLAVGNVAELKRHLAGLEGRLNARLLLLELQKKCVSSPDQHQHHTKDASPARGPASFVCSVRTSRLPDTVET